MANYEKGSFITVPNKKVLRGLHPTAQAIYMWLCNYANEDGNCFPSRKTLSKDAKCSVKTVDNMMKLLVEKGLVTVEHRSDERGDQGTNLYTLPLGVAYDVREGREPGALGGSVRRTHRTQSNRELNPINSSSAKRAGKSPVSFSSEGAQILKAFESVDPKNARMYSNRTQRSAADQLIAYYGLEAVLAIIPALPKINLEPYLSKTYTPYDLLKNWQRIKDHFSSKQISKKPFIV